VPLIFLETAQPVKFAEIIQEVLGREPPCPENCRGLERLPQRMDVMHVDSDAIKDYIENRCQS
jgi:threonine synthase